MTQHNWLKKQVLKRLAQINNGAIVWQDEETVYFGQRHAKLQAKVIIHHQDFYRKFAWRHSIGAAQSYIDGDWSCDNLTVLMQIVIANKSMLAAQKQSRSFITRLLDRLKNHLARNRIRRSRQNILAHYDLSNDFFSLLLDKRKIYSCAVFNDKTADLDSAQQLKLKQICDKLALTPNDHVLEIGSGWGGLAIFAAQNYGCKVTTTTISDAQYDYVEQRIQQLGLSHQITLLKQDYRKLTGQYDKLVAIEMIEAVGYQYFNTFFATCDRLLKSGGRFFLQAITINDAEYERYKHETDFIKAYIFPGGCLPSKMVINKAVTQKTQMMIQEIVEIGQDYALTLQHWHDRLRLHTSQIKQLGFDDCFIRMFEFYFCYCQAGFLANYINNLQVLMTKR